MTSVYSVNVGIDSVYVAGQPSLFLPVAFFYNPFRYEPFRRYLYGLLRAKAAILVISRNLLIKKKLRVQQLHAQKMLMS